MGNSQGLGSHPNPYLLASVLKSELKVGIDNALAAKVGNPNSRPAGNTRKIRKLKEQRRTLMRNLARRNTDLETYMKAIGALSIVSIL